MLVGISGSQGAGKTTILNQLEQQGFNVIKRKTSRSILEEWGITLQEVNSNPELTIRFQNEILKRKWDDEQHARHSSQIWFTERTFIDLAVYCNFALASNNKYNDFVNDYYEQCVNLSQYYNVVFYVKSGHFSIEHDGVRGYNKHYSRMVDLIMEDVHKNAILPSRLIVIDTPILQDRINLITTFTKTLYRM